MFRLYVPYAGLGPLKKTQSHGDLLHIKSILGTTRDRLHTEDELAALVKEAKGDYFEILTFRRTYAYLKCVGAIKLNCNALMWSEQNLHTYLGMDYFVEEGRLLPAC